MYRRAIPESFTSYFGFACVKETLLEVEALIELAM
jgi:hypothetical protein